MSNAQAICAMEKLTETSNTDHTQDSSKTDSFNALTENHRVKFAGQHLSNSLTNATNAFTALTVRLEIFVRSNYKYYVDFCMGKK